jgi:hypothetical protein
MPDRSTGPFSATTEARAARAILVLAIVWGAVLGSNLLQISSWIVGDIAYHRGVAYTMQGLAWQGEGPYPGLLSYYGGLYPLVFGRLAGWLALPFDTVLSVASWALSLLWPLAAWALGRRIWPGRPLTSALFVLLMVTAAPFTNRVLLWVDSPLVSAQNSFPTYPRDLALALVLVAAACTLSASRRGRVLGTGLALGGIVLVHLQIAIVTGWILGIWAASEAIRRRSWRPLAELAAAGATGVIVSAWWWIPRVAATLESGGLLLGGYPGSPPLRIGLDNVFEAFGVIAVLALLGFSVLAARRPLPGRLAFFLAWLVACLPLVIADRLVNGSDLLSERRAWLLMSIPLTVIGAATASIVVARLRPRLAVAFIVLVLLAPSVPGTIATVRLVRSAWEPGHAGGRVFDPTAWDPIFADLVRRVRDGGRHVVVTYDAYETWVWSFSGAQVPSLWLPGPFKLGFDPARLTGLGQLQRWARQEAAFDGGRPAICAFASASEAGSIILDVDDGLVGTFDESPALPYRVDPRQRSDATLQRDLGSGVIYQDRGGMDVLHLESHASWRPAFLTPDAKLLAVEILVPLPPAGSLVSPDPLGEIVTRSGRTAFGRGLPAGPARVVVPVDGVDDQVAIVASAPLDLVRITAFEPVPDLALPIADGPIRLSPDTFCPPS